MTSVAGPGVAARDIRVLMLQFHFPPSTPMAAQRARRLVECLKKNGVQPHVLTTSASGTQSHQIETIGRTPLLILRVAGREPIAWYHQIKRRRATSPPRTDMRPGGSWKNFLRSWMIPDEQFMLVRPWIKAAKNFGSGSIDLIYSTSTPYSAHLVARKLRQAWGCPWVMELRDQWSDNPYLPQTRNRITRRIEERLEARCLKEADRIVVLNETHARNLMERCPAIADRVRVVPNMFEVRSATETEQRCAESRARGPLRLLFAGLLYGGRSLADLGRAVDEANRRGVPGFSSVCLEVAGKSYEGFWEEVLAGSGAGRQVHGLLSPMQVQDLMREVHVGIVNNPRWDHIHIPGKLYEYLGAGLPIFNFSRQPDIPGICEGIVPHWQLDPSDREGILRAISEVAQWWRAHPGGADPPPAEHPYSSRQVARRMAILFREVVSHYKAERPHSR